MQDEGGNRQKIDDDYMYQNNSGTPNKGNFELGDDMLRNNPNHYMLSYAPVGAESQMNSFIGGAGGATNRSGTTRKLMHGASMLSTTNSIIPNFGRGGL